jgi:hypothetical protein
MMEHIMGLQRIEEGVERDVRLLGVAGISFSDVIRNMITVIQSDQKLVQTVREMPFEKNIDAVRSPSEAPLPDRKRAKRGEVKPSEFYKDFILRLLRDSPGHSLSTKHALRLLEPMVRPHLKPADYAALPKTGVPRWPNKAQWARQRLVDDGLLKTVAESGRGQWALTPAGLKAAQRLK